MPDFPEVVVPYQELLVMEQNGMKQLPKVVGGQVIELDIHALLNGVDIEGTRRRERAMGNQGEAVRLFYSYSHKDETLRNELETHLKLLHRQGLIEPWHDRQIEAGDEWKQKIDEHLERAAIILLLVSADFIASDYCYEKEMQQALERHERRGAGDSRRRARCQLADCTVCEAPSLAQGRQGRHVVGESRLGMAECLGGD